MRLIYVMDPMCSWCYAFNIELEEFLTKYPFLEVEYIMGGLAPDTYEPMNEEMKKVISSYWFEIEKKTQVTFNHDFWKSNTPFRSTYPACRAVISAEAIETKSSSKMAKAIQTAYYKEAKNPSLKEVLVECAVSIGLDRIEFLKIFNSYETEEKFKEHLNKTYQLQVRGFPALFYIDDKNKAYPLTFGFTKASILEQQFSKINKNYDLSTLYRTQT